MLRLTSSLVLVWVVAGWGNQAAAQVSDPELAAFVKASGQRIAAHPFFKGITLLPTSTEHPPFVFYLERPPRDEPGYQRRIVNSYLPFLEKLVEVFEKEYAGPLGLSRRPEAAGFAIAVLASRGSYHNFAQAVQVKALHNARAHYDPRMRLAVTYVDAFSPHGTGPEDRQAVLHEFVHVLQHAYSATGNMSDRVWFNEGLAEYRSACGHLASSLESPALDRGHLETLVSVLASPRHKPLLSPLADLVFVDSYADAVKRAGKRLGVPPDPRMARLALQVFYAQSAAFVAFLHAGEGGKHRQAFQDYAAAVMRGRPTTDTILPSLEAAFRRHVAAEAKRRLGVELGVGATDLGDGTAVLPPPIEYDSTKLRWRSDELGVRLAAARAQCARGKYEAAAELLHGVEGSSEDVSMVKREAKRVAAVLRLRDELFRVAEKNRTRFWIKVDGERVRGEFMGREGDSFVLKDKDLEQRLPLTALTPQNLAFECKKVDLVSGSSWETAWLKWLGGLRARRALRNLEDTAPGRALRADLRGRGRFEPRGAEAAVALADIQDLRPAKEPAEARKQLAQLEEAIRSNRRSTLFSSRKAALQLCVRALAQRAFSLDDPRSLGLAGRATRGPDGSITVHYDGRGKTLAKDFRRDKDWTRLLLSRLPRLATSGSYIRPARKYIELCGSGVFVWPFGLRGRQVIELGAELTNVGDYRVLLCGNTKAGYVAADMFGTVAIDDAASGISDNVGESQQLRTTKVHVLRIEHDGKKRLTVSLDGKTTAELTRVGSRVRGAFGLLVHASQPLRIHSLKVRGTVSARNALELRQAFVERVLRELWP